uniref:Peptidase S1 domain-containing protein n=1 Tax=Clastoptera arizonana TaxID=38151 RepID=A0A1B6DCK7_9HEMI
MDFVSFSSTGPVFIVCLSLLYSLKGYDIPSSISICVPKNKCLDSNYLETQLFCPIGYVYCVETNKDFEIYTTSSKDYLQSRKTKEEISTTATSHFLSKRGLPLGPPQFYVPNNLFGPVYFYPYPSNGYQNQQNMFGSYPINNGKKPISKNKILNADLSKMAGVPQTTQINPNIYFNLPSKVTPNKDSIIFEEREYHLNDPYAESIKRNFEKYMKEKKRLDSSTNAYSADKRMSKYKFHSYPGLKSLKYCEEFKKYVSNSSGNEEWDLLIRPGEKNSCSHPMPLIVGGHKAQHGEFPHMAGIGFDRGHFIEFLCGGSLISPTFVLTAAHCAKTKWGNPVMVRIGVNNINHNNGQNMDIVDIVIHPQYQPPSCYNDIALIKIADGVKLGPDLRPACLPIINAGDKPGHLATATGWGRTGYGKVSSDSLLKVTLQIIGKNECEKYFNDKDSMTRLSTGIETSMICATGYLKKTHDTCQGDSGGPLQSYLPNDECMHQIVGITSFGKLCGKGLPGVYTKVSSFISWIEEIVWPDS